MATKNSSSFVKNYKCILLAAFLTLASCQSIKTREDLPGAHEEEKGPEVVQPPKYEVPPSVTPPPQGPAAPSPIPAIPKIGLILGPGGARAFGHVGVLQNLTRMKVPIHGTVGIEWGAPVSALWASKGQVYDVEWQMAKLKDEDIQKKSLIGSPGKMNDVSALKDFFQTAFARQRVEEFRHPFACPAYNIAKNQVYMMSRGYLEQLMPYCVPYPPLFKPFSRNVSAIREVKMAADYLRSHGANYIVLVNVLGKDAGRKALVKDADSADGILWSEVASFYAKPQPGVDAMINVELDSYLVSDFEKKREILQKGAELSQRPLETWARKLGF